MSQENIPHTVKPQSPAWTVCWLQIRTWPSAASAETHQTRLRFSVFIGPVLVKLWPLQPKMSALGRQDSRFDMFTLRRFLCSPQLWRASYHSLLPPVSLLSSDLCHQQDFSADLPLTGGVFFVFHIILSKPCCEKPRRSAVSEIVRRALLAATIMSRTKVQGAYFFSILMFNLFNKWSSWYLSVWFYAKHCSTRVGWLDKCMNKLVYRWSLKKMLSECLSATSQLCCKKKRCYSF